MTLTNDQLTSLVTALVQKLYPTLLERIKQLESRVQVLESAGAAVQAQAQAQAAQPASDAPVKVKRKARNFADYCAIQELAGKGRTEKDISAELGIPYTTVRAYLRMTDSEIIKLKNKAQESARPVPPTTVIECPVSPTPYGEDGWREWPMKNRQLAETNKDAATGYPAEAPCLPTDVVSVMYENGYISAHMPADLIDWTQGGGVARWICHATD